VIAASSANVQRPVRALNAARQLAAAPPAGGIEIAGQ